MEILKGLGAIEDNGMVGFKTDNPVLYKYPMTMEDDGMAYGVNEKFIIEASVNKEDNSIIIFIDKKDETE
jgi:hypothetical protein